MKFHFIFSIVFYAVAMVFFRLSGMTELALAQRKILLYVGFIPAIAGAVEWIVLVCQLLDKFEHIDKLKQVADGMYLLRKDLAKASSELSSELRDINCHVCDGFNGIAEIVSDQRAA